MRTLALVATAVVLAGCSFSLGGPDAVSTSELEKQLAALYEPNNPGEGPIAAECDGELAAEVDATQECKISVGEDNAMVRVTVTKVGDELVDFEARPFVPAEELSTTIQDTLVAQGFKIDSVSCDDELPGEVDASAICAVTGADGDEDVEATVTSVEGLLVNFDIDAAP